MNMRLFFFLILLNLFINQNLMALDKVSLQLKWKNQFQFAGYYMAKEKGFYKQSGLDVDILEYSLGTNIVQSVTNGNTNFAVGYSSVVLDKARGSDIVLLSAIYQNSPHVLISLASSGIKSIKDFKDKTLMISKDAIKTVSLFAMLRSNNLSVNDIKIKEPTFNIQTLLDNKVQISTAYISNELYQLDHRGIDYNVWDPKNYGFDFYDDILFTSTKELQEHPKRVEAFQKASLKGFEYAFSHIDETVDVILKKYNTQHRSREALVYEAKALKSLAYEGTKSLGSISKVKIQRMIDIYNLFGLIKQTINLDTFVYTPPNKLKLTQKEKKYLQNKKTITMCVDPDWMPLESLKNGQHIGMSADYFKLIRKKLDVKIDVIPTKNWTESVKYFYEKKCDIFSLVMPTPKRKKFIKFTNPYLKIPLVMATRQDAPFMDNVYSIRNKKVGITQEYAFYELLKVKYPNLDIVAVKDIQDGLQQVSEGKLYGYIGTLASIGYSLQKDFIGVLKISGKFDGIWGLGIGVQKKDTLLYSILQKTVKSISEAQKQKIFNTWLSVKYEKSVNYKYLLQVVAIFIVILAIIIYLYIRKRKFTKKIQAQNEKIKLNHALLKTLFDTIPNPIFYKDIDGVYQNCNSAFSETILNLPKKEIIGKTLYDSTNLITQELSQMYKEKDNEFYSIQSFDNYETQIQCPDNIKRDFNVYKSTVFSENAEKLGFLGIMFDITELRKEEKELEKLASIDPLTNLYNRRYFTHASEHILALAKREKSALSVLMLDIDNFKLINDTYGHKIGDDVLIILSNILLNTSRDSDVACRFGGEEFLILLPKTELEGASIIAEKLRKNIASHSFSVEGFATLSFTVSIGASQVKVQTEKNVEKAIKRADDALYEAKNSGKNRVCLN